jgi:hypothetical protein
MAPTRTSIRRLARPLGTCACLAALAAGAAPRPAPVAAQEAPLDAPAGLGPGAGALLATVAARVEGFRHARFGMSEPEVRQAARRDFPDAAGRLSRTTHASEKTTVLAVTANGLLPDAGPARVSYVLGYASKRLVQVNVVWSSDGRSAARDEAVVAAANILRDHFQGQHIAPPDEVVANRQVGEGAFLVFRAAQADGRMVVVVLSGAGAAERARTPTLAPLTLQLSYIGDYQHTDVFRIEGGRF